MQGCLPDPAILKVLLSEVSKRGWRTEGVGARKSLPHHKFRPFYCPFFLCPLRSRRTQFWGTFFAVFWALLGANPLPLTPFSKPLVLRVANLLCVANSQRVANRYRDPPLHWCHVLDSTASSNFFSLRMGQCIAKMVSIVKTLWLTNSLSFPLLCSSIFTMAGSFGCFANLNVLKTTPTPNKKRLIWYEYAMKVGVCMPQKLVREP